MNNKQFVFNITEKNTHFSFVKNKVTNKQFLFISRHEKRHYEKNFSHENRILLSGGSIHFGQRKTSNKVLFSHKFLQTCEKFARIGRGVLVALLSTILAHRRLGLKRLSGHFLIQLSKLNKNMAVWTVQVGTKLGKLKFIKKWRKIGFFTPIEFFRFFKRKKAFKKIKNHIFLLAVQFSIEWYIRHRKIKFYCNFALRAPY